jgi:hypothetical protein
MRRTLLIATAVVAAVALAVAIVGFLDGGGEGTIRMTRFYERGPSALYGSDFGGIGTVPPLEFPLPAGTWDIVITLSIEYETTSDEGFVVGVSAPRERPATFVPKEWPLPAAVQGRLTTVLFHSAGLEGGRDYSFAPYVNIGFQRTGDAEITSGRVLMVVDATPSA